MPRVLHPRPAGPLDNARMTSPKSPDAARELDKPLAPEEDKPDTNEVQHHPNPKAEPIPDGDPKWHPKSPYTTGNY